MEERGLNLVTTLCVLDDPWLDLCPESSVRKDGKRREGWKGKRREGKGQDKKRIFCWCKLGSW